MRIFLLSLLISLKSISSSSAAEFPIEIAKEILSAAMTTIDAEEQTQRALDAAANAIENSGPKDLVVVLPENIIEEYVSNELQKLESVDDLKVEPELGEGRFSFSIAGVFSQEDVEIAAKISGAIAMEVKNGELSILPAISDIELDRISVGSSIQANLAEATLRRILPRMPGRSSAVLTGLIDPIPLKFDAFELDTQKELVELAQIQNAAGPKLKFTVTPERPVVFVSPEAVYILANLPGNQGGKSDTPPNSYSGIRNAVLAEVKRLSGSHLQQGGMAIQKAAIARYLNSALPNRNPIISADFMSDDAVDVKFSEKIELAGRPDYSCSPNRVCSAASCNINRDCSQRRECRQPHDTRNCNRCLVNNPFGGCSIRGNDPICEAAKAAQNAAYAAARGACEAEKVAARNACEAQKATEVAACEAREAAAKLDCERLKIQEVAECEAKRGIQNLLAELGGVGAISADLAVDYSGRINIASLAFSPNMGVNATVTVSARAHANGPVSFTPYDVVGHAICGTNWRKTLDISASGSGSVNLSSTLKNIRGTPHLVLETRRTNVTATSAPPLRDFFNRNPDLRVRCPGLNVVDLTNDAVKRVTGEGAHPILDGRYEIDVPAIRVEEPIETLRLTLGGREASLKPSINDVALTFTLAR